MLGRSLRLRALTSLCDDLCTTKFTSAIAHLQRKIAETERCISDHKRRTRRPLATDLRGLAKVSWSNWAGRGLAR
jgi:hypothetical protein